ncbi:MAG TPA: flagellar hook-associated protein FlgK [Paenibacillaceae bacterium]
MRSTFHGLETSKRALLTTMVAMQTVGHNIANVSTEGYSRQRVNLTESRPIEAPGFQRSAQRGMLGTGVEYESITRVRDSYLDLQYRRENALLNSWDVRNTVLSSIEAIINEPSETGLRAVLDKFWNSWEVLNRDPMLLSARVDVVGAAVNLADTLNHIGSALSNLEKDLSGDVDKAVLEANDLIQNIAGLTDIIRRTEALGDNANDYRDQRDLMIDKLSNLIDVQVTETPDGNFTIVAGGVTVVNNTQFTLLTAEVAETATGGKLHGITQALVDIQRTRDQLNAMVDTMMRGTIRVRLENGYVTSRDMTALNDVTLEDGTVITAGNTIPAGSRIVSPVEFEVEGFNGLHRLGYSLSDPATSDIPFFVTSDGSAAFTLDNIRVNSVIRNDTNMIAASGKYETVNGVNVTIKGNSDIAHALAALRDARFQFPSGMTSLSSGTIDDYFRAAVSDVGTRAANAERNHLNQEDLVHAVQLRRQSVSGVSLDEEMVELIKFQHAYNAAARNMTVVDEVLDRIINHMGIVGR